MTRKSRDKQHWPVAPDRSLTSPILLRSWWETWSYLQAGGMIGLLVSLALVPLDLALLGFDLARLPKLAWLRLISGELVLPLLLVVVLGNGLLIDRLVSRRLPPTLLVTPGQRITRFLRASPPLIGLLEVVRWQKTALSATSCGQAVFPIGQLELGSATDGVVSATWRTIDLILRRFESSVLWYVWLAGPNVVVLGLTCCWLGMQVLQHPGRLAPILGVSLLLHLVTFHATRRHVVEWSRMSCLPATRQRLSQLASFGLLLPAPLCTFFAFALVTQSEPGRERSITRTALRQRSLGTSAGLRRSPDTLAARLAGTDQLEGDDSLILRNAPLLHDVRDLQSLLRTKTLCLFPEAMVFGWLTATLSRQAGAVAGWLWRATDLFSWFTLAVAGAALLLVILRLIVLRVGMSLPVLARQRWAGPLALSAMVLTGGWRLGLAVGSGYPAWCASILCLVGELGSLGLAFRLILQNLAPHQFLTRLSIADAVLWVAPLVAASGLGAVMAADPVAALPSLHRLVNAMWAGSVLGILAGLSHYRWVMQSLAAGTPPVSGTARRLLVATVVLPLGGLACPWWVAFRDHQHSLRMTAIAASMGTVETVPDLVSDRSS